ncbi:MAG: 30S ribosomal protein S12 methylthiotransferase RimO [Bacteroidales bacterium]|nr:30S ribosomal protein S12 methylthiotransferase RimO [Bacteroidales bacterium]
MQTLRVITLGCSKNTVDTEHLLYQVRGSYEIVPEDDFRAVDVEAINTCGFIGDAKEQSIQVILEEAGKKKAGRIGRLLVFGCLSQRYSSELPELIPEVDGWFGARELDSLVTALGCRPSMESAHKRILTTPGRPYAFFKISEGCNRRCSYCAIPYIRGPHRSVPIETLVAEARDLAAQGIRELVIIAQDTTYYGLDIYGKRSLARLLQELSKVDGIEWLRLHYSYPADFPEDVLDEMASNPKVCRYMDIPLQHISDSVLAAMHRGVDGAWTRALIERMRERVPGVVLRTTMIVGHPGEGTREFNELLRFVKEARFQRLGAFTYSEEEGTFGAENLKDSVRPSTKKKRLDALMEAQRGISLAYNQSRIGTEEKVLADSLQDGVLVCRSEFESPEVDGEILVKAPAGVDAGALVGTFFNVRITAADEYDLIAEII